MAAAQTTPPLAYSMAASDLPSGATMRRATTADIPAIVSVYMDSFRHDLFSRQVFPRSASSSMTYWTRAVAEEMAEAEAVWFVVTEPIAGQQETVQAFVKWTRPGAPFPDPDAADVYPPEGNPALAVALYARVMGAHRERMWDTPHWYLDMMGVRCACQRRGFARAMVGWGIKQSQRGGCPLYVDATGDARGFYENMGFEMLGRDDDDCKVVIETTEGDVEIYMMLRKPNALLEGPDRQSVASTPK
ncbi:acetyltransferase, GNAT family [Akanthomyces lecanii RCEF 1005]|uniref:Acetyltransferase, GNAT family n=1 Tax=Akanthomyces lecanii RCEF 1005 TaxID=1081108 RepID=A0A168JKS4_CORDF|nr:acetyltransferase, GNAT family [Akanthomyces lecanii RCEF 1005]